MPDNRKLDYVEFATRDIAASKAFFETVFEWKFTDYGPDYTAFMRAEAGMDGGFYKGEPSDGALVIFYASDLETVLSDVTSSGGELVKPIFDFPGGQRFEFCEPGGNMLAVWSDPV
ncbi:MAG: VOC family protein [Hyphomonadaceae bacterium]